MTTELSITKNFLNEARRDKGIFGEVVISPAMIDQMVTLNPVTLEGQAEIIYNVWLYRMAKWHWNAIKSEETITITPTAPPAFAAVMAQKERLEGQVKSGLASAAQAVADYELLKHDVRRYREILDFFKEGEKDEHVLRSLFVDRVDAHTGEGYSMITMAKRWPTIISDFIRMKTKWRDVDKLMKELQVSRAEGTVLKTKNELYIEWKKQFFPDVKERYARIKNLLDSRAQSVNEYRKWLKPYINRLKRIREASEIKASTNIDDPLDFANTPTGNVTANLWLIKPFKPEEVGKPIYLRGAGEELSPMDDWFWDKIKLVEKEHGVRFYETKEEMELVKKQVKKEGKKWNNYNIIVSEKIKGFYGGPGVSPKKGELLASHPGPIMDPRVLYYIFVDLDYQIDYKKGSTGPMIVEDQYFSFHPFLVSQNALLLFLLENEAKKMAFEREVDRMIGAENIEKEILKDVEAEFEKEDEVAKRFDSSFRREKKPKKKGTSDFKKKTKPFVRLFVRPGPYEINIGERISKSYGDYFGPQVAEQVELIKQTCFRLSGVGL